MIMSSRMRSFKIPRNAPIGAYMRYDPRVTNRPFLEILCEAVEDLALRRGKLLVIDTLHAWAGLELNLEQKPRECAAFFDRLRSAARLGGFAVLLLHHTKKSAETARGCEALRGSVDTLVYLQCPYEGSYARVLHISHPSGAGSHNDSGADIPVCLGGDKKYGGSRRADAASGAARPVRLGGDSDEVNAASGAARLAYEYSPFDGFMETEGASAADAVWFALPRSGEGVTIQELIERTGLSKTGVNKALGKLAGQERVEISGEGKRESPYLVRRVNDL